MTFKVYYPPLPDEIVLLVHDIISDIRIPLDHVMFKVAYEDARNKSPTKIGLSFFNSLERYEKWKKENAKFFPPEIFVALDRWYTTPPAYAGGKDMLYALNVLSNWEKHRHLEVNAAAAQVVMPVLNFIPVGQHGPEAVMQWNADRTVLTVFRTPAGVMYFPPPSFSSRLVFIGDLPLAPIGVEVHLQNMLDLAIALYDELYQLA